MTTGSSPAVSSHTFDTTAVDEDVHPLDDPIRQSLRGVHAHFARWSGRIGGYHPDVAGHIGHPSVMQDEDWADLAALVGPSTEVAVREPGHEPPPGWETLGSFGLVQMDGTDLVVEPDPDLVVLGTADVPEILDLVARTRPGPYLPRTVEMGTYLGIRVNGRLVAMAGERLHPPGWSEISAVCTDAEFRGCGYGTRLVKAVGAGIRARGEIPFLHASAANTTAIRLYETLGFTLRKRSVLTRVRTPPERPVVPR
ncbi:GNAT family N-acetyltransferase [Rhodococcus sp. O3]|uniref:GNAT family N-acetyltransferase n=1 Tax=Rhodococcus sp. O3 TaxID=3404919 RepID=UPI003B67AB6C